jgi:(E)-4-hydroxy-3-methylbut-2-enyl-diphosphate synthase
MIKRKKTRQVSVGNVKIGGNAPISIQSMTNTVTADARRTVAQIKALERAGCEIARVAVKDMRDAEAIGAIKRNIKIPLVADIHFDHRLALQCIRGGVDKVRLNPGNVRNREEILEVVRAAKKARIPIRIGVNSGSVKRPGESAGDLLVKSALKYIKLFESVGFRDIIISLKSSDVVSTIESYRKMSALCNYPLHLGVTATGHYDSGIVKSSVGIGALLAEGIGDTIRVSLTADPIKEIEAGRRILSALGLRNFGPEIISCPTCGRCKVDLIKMVEELEKKLSAISYKLSAKRPLKIALMGCEVNGPGEAREADLGVAFGKGSGVLFKRGKVVRTIKSRDAVDVLMRATKLLLRTSN